MKDKKSSLLLYGLLLGGIIGAGIATYFSSKLLSKSIRDKRERKHKFYEGIDDIFDDSSKFKNDDETQLDDGTKEGIIDELFSRSD